MGAHHWVQARATAALMPDCAFVEVSSSQNRYPWSGYQAGGQVRYSCLFEKPFEEVASAEMSSAVVSCLEELEPRVIFIPGYNAPYMRVVARWAKSRGKVPVLCSDSWVGTSKKPWLKEQFKRFLIPRLYAAAFVSGELAAAYAVSLGIAPQRVWRGLDVVDNEHFASGAESARSTSGLRERLGLPGDYMLCVSRMVAEKNLHVLIQAYAEYRRHGGPFHMVIVGDGPLKADLKRQIDAAGLAPFVQLRAWATYEELPPLYGLARCLVLPSCSETWGLVVNEAMAAGLAVLVSNECGCCPDLCWPGINGFVFDYRNPGQLARAMGRMSDGSVDPAAMGRASCSIISNWTARRWALSLADCVRTLEPSQGLQG
jgi:glycosyltransferase involved in cell wall biosynthesis